MKGTIQSIVGTALAATLWAFSGSAMAILCPTGTQTTEDLTTGGTSYTDGTGAIYTSINASGSVGTGVFPAFVKIQGNDNCLAGYNTDGTLQFDTNNSPIIMFTLDTMNVISQGGNDYVEFILDINQQSSNPLLSLDNVQIFTSTSNTLTGYSDCLLGGVNCSYSLDQPGSNLAMLLDYNLNSGSGNGFDMTLLVPTSVFAGVTVPSKTYVYLYSSFGAVGGNYVENDGGEEWAYNRCPAGTVCWRDPPPPPPTVPEPGTLALIGISLLSGVAVGRKRRMDRAA